MTTTPTGLGSIESNKIIHKLELQYLHKWDSGFVPEQNTTQIWEEQMPFNFAEVIFRPVIIHMLLPLHALALHIYKYKYIKLYLPRVRMYI